MSIKNNTAELQSILEAVNSLPSAGGAEYSVTFVNVPSTANIVITVEYGGQMIIEDSGLNDHTYKIKSPLIVIYDVDNWTVDSYLWSVSDGVIIQDISDGGFKGGFIFIDVSQTGGECTIEFIG